MGLSQNLTWLFIGRIIRESLLPGLQRRRLHRRCDAPRETKRRVWDFGAAFVYWICHWPRGRRNLGRVQRSLAILGRRDAHSDQRVLWLLRATGIVVR